MRALMAAVACVVALALSGCADDPESSTSNGATGVGTPEPTSTGSTAEPDGPPPEAGEASEAGAEAFVRYYLGALSDGYNVLTVDEIHEHALESCATCHDWADAYTETKNQGGDIVSGDATWQVDDVVVSAFQPGEMAEVTALVTIGKHSLTSSATGAPIERPESKLRFDFVVIWQGDSWAVGDMQDSQV